jgi:dephospho-CoA kinase
MDKVNNSMKPVRRAESGWTGSFHKRRSIVIGLTGGIASGKSTVARMFCQLGATVISADEIAHNLLAPGTDVYKSVVREFGSGILLKDNTINRKKLARLVFEDPDKRACLDAIMHPPILQQLQKAADAFREKGRGVLILEIPLLIETDSTKIVDKVIVVAAKPETQIKRLKERYGITQKEAEQRVSAQFPLSRKLEYADWVIETESSLIVTKAQVIKVWDSIEKSIASEE